MLGDMDNASILGDMDNASILGDMDNASILRGFDNASVLRDPDRTLSMRSVMEPDLLLRDEWPVDVLPFRAICNGVGIFARSRSRSLSLSLPFLPSRLNREPLFGVAEFLRALVPLESICLASSLNATVEGSRIEKTSFHEGIGTSMCLM